MDGHLEHAVFIALLRRGGSSSANLLTVHQCPPVFSLRGAQQSVDQLGMVETRAGSGVGLRNAAKGPRCLAEQATAATVIDSPDEVVELTQALVGPFEKLVRA